MLKGGTIYDMGLTDKGRRSYMVDPPPEFDPARHTIAFVEQPPRGVELPPFVTQIDVVRVDRVEGRK